MGKLNVTVGFDGSPPSRAALRWAADEALRRAAPLRIVSAYHAPAASVSGPAGRYDSDAEARVEQLVDEAVTETRSAAPDIDVSGVAVFGQPAQVLLDAANGAGLVVVGSGGHNGFAAALIGAVSQQVATHAPCPVAVVRGRADTVSGPVVVGVDGSASAEHALAVAYEQAASRGTGLVAIGVFAPPMSAWLGVPPVPFDPDLARTQVHAALGQSTAAWTEKYPSVSVNHLAAQGNVAQILVDASRGAQLVVVGTRGHGGFTGLLLGSVGLHLIHHADCPVLIARGEARAEPAPSAGRGRWDGQDDGRDRAGRQ